MTQNDRILVVLQFQQRDWTPMPKLVEISGSYNVHSRIAELRKRGHRVECKITHHKNGAKHSFYRLVSGNNDERPHNASPAPAAPVFCLT